MKLLFQVLLVLSVSYTVKCQICPTCPANTDDRTNYEALNKINTVIPPEFIPPCGRTAAACNANDKFRRIDASCNNLNFPQWGLPNSTYARLLSAIYNDGISTPRMAVDKTPLPGARSIRVELFPTAQLENQIRNLNAMQWGQFVTHDMSLLKEPNQDIPCCSTNGQLPAQVSRMCFPIRISMNDPTQGAAGIRCMNFTRTVTDKDVGCGIAGQPARPINLVTSYLDLSNVYSNDDGMSRSLRTFVGGALKVEIRNNKIYPPRETNIPLNCPCNAVTENVCYRTGDPRTNQNPHLAIQQILLHREHNRLANALRTLNPHWNDERLFQEARRINIAQFQRITFYEWMPIMLGLNNLVSKGILYPSAAGFVNDYNSNIIPDVTNEHAHAAFRSFHTQIAGLLRLLSEQRTVLSTTPITNWINRPQILELGTNMEQLTVGLVSQPIEETDQRFVEQMSDRLFACRGVGFGRDLKALDIQRDRDHGLAYYNDYRRLCGLRVAASFDDYGDIISAQNIVLLKKFYKNYRDVDLSVGGSLENFVSGAQVGPTFYCIITEQFKRTRLSDRFWFENTASGLTLAQLAEIRKATVAKLFCNNGNGITRIQPKAFLTVSGNGGTILPCSSIPAVDLTKWKETVVG